MLRGWSDRAPAIAFMKSTCATALSCVTQNFTYCVKVETKRDSGCGSHLAVLVEWHKLLSDQRQHCSQG